jgi:cytidylate kinase
MAAITISRQFGSGGDEIADHICQSLGYRHFDKRLIVRAAAEAGFSEQEGLDFSEENYKVKNFIERLSARSRPVARVRVWKESTTGVRVAEEMQLSEEHALILVQKAVDAAYQNGNVVMIGRGGQILLKGRPDVLHVRIEAPMEDRIQRVKLQLKLEKKMALDTLDTRRAAQDLIAGRDAASADYLKRFYGVDWSDPLHYHLVINSGKLSLVLAAQVVIDLVHCLENTRMVV